VYSVTIRDHMMVAHNLRRAMFGPARPLHSATYVVDATFRSEAPDAESVVVDAALPPNSCTRWSAC
jgi:hypothetical protein